jgi:hypothetical protein
MFNYIYSTCGINVLIANMIYFRSSNGQHIDRPQLHFQLLCRRVKLALQHLPGDPASALMPKWELGLATEVVSFISGLSNRCTK